MQRIRLRFESLRQIVSPDDDLCIIMLTDEARLRVLSVVCDNVIGRQMLLRLQNNPLASTMLPEALLDMLDTNLEMMIYGIHNEQYQVVLSDDTFLHQTRLRISDAVLLMIIRPDIPLFIEAGLMERQSVPYEIGANSVAIPLNTLATPHLKQALDKAVAEEKYELASHIRDEINKRKEQQRREKAE